MLQSMTGYGEASSETQELYIHIIVKTLNSKHLDIHFNLPKRLAPQEIQWRKKIKQKFQRGTIHIELIYFLKKTPLTDLIDQTAFKTCYYTLYQIAKDLQTKTDLFSATLQLLKNNLPPTITPLPDPHLFLLNQTLDTALEKCLNSRALDAKAMLQQIHSCIDTLASKLNEIHLYMPERNALLRAKAMEKFMLREVENTKESPQWEKEITQYLEKLTIEEEITRLKSHLDYFQQTLKTLQPIGKKLGFVAQEIGRELNTIAAKAQNVKLQHTVITMKEALEQIKEQLQNLV
ncbi:MAG: DUF1732 domain-containing protein [Bacteroidota bacterium]